MKKPFLFLAALCISFITVPVLAQSITESGVDNVGEGHRYQTSSRDSSQDSPGLTREEPVAETGMDSAGEGHRDQDRARDGSQDSPGLTRDRPITETGMDSVGEGHRD